jgi:hypothetical protein
MREPLNTQHRKHSARSIWVRSFCRPCPSLCWLLGPKQFPQNGFSANGRSSCWPIDAARSSLSTATRATRRPFSATADTNAPHWRTGFQQPRQKIGKRSVSEKPCNCVYLPHHQPHPQHNCRRRRTISISFSSIAYQSRAHAAFAWLFPREIYDASSRISSRPSHQINGFCVEHADGQRECMYVCGRSPPGAA